MQISLCKLESGAVQNLCLKTKPRKEGKMPIRQQKYAGLLRLIRGKPSLCKSEMLAENDKRFIGGCWGGKLSLCKSLVQPERGHFSFSRGGRGRGRG